MASRSTCSARACSDPPLRANEACEREKDGLLLEFGVTASSLWKVVNRRGIRALIGIVICGHPIIANAQSSGVSSIGRFARVLHRDVDAVKNAITEKWSNGQAEGQINRRKTLKRAMYGRAGVELRALACSPSHNPRARKVTQTPIKYSATRAILAIFFATQ
jgi:hypothetical protein